MANAVTPEKFDYIFKIVLIGDSGVGKTNLLSQLTKQEFCSTTPPTIGVEFATISFKINNDIIKAQIWDTAGQERYRAITSAYYRGTYGALIVFDITEKDSIKSINHWLIQLRQFSKKDTQIFLIGNKKDLEEQREITEKEAETIAQHNNLIFFEASAFSGENVNQIFYELIKNIYEKNKLTYEKKTVPKFEVLKSVQKFKKGKKKNNCC